MAIGTDSFCLGEETMQYVRVYFFIDIDFNFREEVTDIIAKFGLVYRIRESSSSF